MLVIIILFNVSTFYINCACLGSTYNFSFSCRDVKAKEKKVLVTSNITFQNSSLCNFVKALHIYCIEHSKQLSNRIAV